MQKDGATNEDVTAFRHALVEFDRNEAGETIPKDVQFGAIVSSGLPVSVVIDSGNKSIHAWVQVDAPDAAEYRRRWTLCGTGSRAFPSTNRTRILHVFHAVLKAGGPWMVRNAANVSWQPVSGQNHGLSGKLRTPLMGFPR
jgi:hypothetical protein